MHIYSHNYKLKKSKIHGLGMYANKFIHKDDVIGIGIVFKMYVIPIVTEDFGKWINHSNDANSHLYYHSTENMYFVVASKDIPENTEITLDYNDTPWYIMKPLPDFK